MKDSRQSKNHLETIGEELSKFFWLFVITNIVCSGAFMLQGNRS